VFGEDGTDEQEQVLQVKFIGTCSRESCAHTHLVSFIPYVEATPAKDTAGQQPELLHCQIAWVLHCSDEILGKFSRVS